MQNGSTHAHIPGWGADLNHENRPGYPMERMPPRLEGVHWNEPEQQAQTVEILQSIEHPAITPVFGTTVPPSGLSGKVREIAFKYSENDIRHWMLLLVADRINMGEGIVDDLSRGHLPNILAEMGWKAEWKYNRAGAIKKAAVATAVFGVGIYLLCRKNSRS